MSALSMCALTGLGLPENAAIQQAINSVLSTPKGCRCMRPDFGSLLPDLLGQPQNPQLRLQLLAATYSALIRWEPRIKLQKIGITSPTPGKIVLVLQGVLRRNQQPLAVTIALGENQ